MKKTLALLLTVVCVACLFGCGVQNDDLTTQFPEYYGQDGGKGLEVYLWQEADGTYLCGVLPGTNRDKTNEEVLALTQNGATIEQMKTILSSYTIERDKIVIIPVRILETSYEILFSDFDGAKTTFWSD